MKKTRSIKYLVALALTLTVGAFALAYQSPGNATGHVNDFANVISSEQKSTLENELQLFKASTSNEVVVVTVPTLGDETVETYATKLFAEWKIGNAKNDNGVLLLLSTNERKVRIEVGYGLEGALPDLLANRILSNDIVPLLKQGSYGDALTTGSQKIIKAIEGEVYQATPKPWYTKLRTGDIAMVMFGAFWLIAWVARILADTKSWWLGGVMGGVLGALSSFAFGYLIWLLLAGIIIGLLVDFVLSKVGITPSTPWGGGSTTWGGGSFGGGSSFGGFGGGSSGGGGSSSSY